MKKLMILLTSMVNVYYGQYNCIINYNIIKKDMDFNNIVYGILFIEFTKNDIKYVYQLNKTINFYENYEYKINKRVKTELKEILIYNLLYSNFSDILDILRGKAALVKENIIKEITLNIK